MKLLNGLTLTALCCFGTSVNAAEINLAAPGVDQAVLTMGNQGDSYVAVYQQTGAGSVIWDHFFVFRKAETVTGMGTAMGMETVSRKVLIPAPLILI